MKKPLEQEGMAKVVIAKSSVVPSKLDAFEEEIKELEAAVLRKNKIIQKQTLTIENMEAELIKRHSTMDDQKLLAILLEREAARVKNLVEVG